MVAARKRVNSMGRGAACRIDRKKKFGRQEEWNKDGGTILSSFHERLKTSCMLSTLKRFTHNNSSRFLSPSFSWKFYEGLEKFYPA